MSLVGRAELQLDLVPTFRLNVLQQEIETTGSRLNSFLVTEY